MEKYMDNYDEYKRFVRKCKCGCAMHCGHSCLDCDNCSDCDCEYCLEGQGQN